jgi:selenocysteine-specific elongation factor
MAETGLTPEALLRLMRPLMSANQLIHIPGDLLVTGEVLEAAIENITTRLKAGASQTGLRRAELKSQSGLCKELFDFAIQKLARERKIRLNGELVCPFESDAQAAGKDRTALDAIAGAYEAAGLAAPQAAEVATKLNLADVEMRRLMTLLLRDRTLIKMGAEALYIHRGALAQLRAQVSELRGQTLDVAGFKQLTGLSRKYAIPLLEYLDRERITRKQGDHRLIL